MVAKPTGSDRLAFALERHEACPQPAKNGLQQAIRYRGFATVRAGSPEAGNETARVSGVLGVAIADALAQERLFVGNSLDVADRG